MMSSEVYYKRNNKVIGPVSTAELDYLRSIGRVDASTLVRYGKASEWEPLSKPKVKTKPLAAVIASATVRQPIREPLRVAAQPKDRQPGIPVPPATPSIDADHNSMRTQLTAACLLAIALLILIAIFWDSLKGFQGTGESALIADTAHENTTGSGAQDQAEGATASMPPEQHKESTEHSTATSERDGTSQHKPEQGADGEEEHVSDVGTQQSETVLPGDPISKFTIAPGGATTFFGLSATGNSFAFVVDRSGSMDGLPLQRAKDELMKSIRGLPQQVEVMIVFFDDSAHPYPGGAVKLTDSNVMLLDAWVQRLPIGGGTNPVAGIRHVLEQWQPEVIFLLTDGAVGPSTPLEIRALNSSGTTQVNTVALVSNSGEAVLKMIAADNSGDYRFVP